MASCQELTQLLANVGFEDEHLPAIYDVWAIEDSPFPYIVNRVTEDKNFSHPYKSRFTLYLDVWDYNENSTKLAREISNIVKKLFNDKIMKHPDYGAIQSWLDTRGQLQSDLPGISHIVHQITIHAWDTDLEI